MYYISLILICTIGLFYSFNIYKKHRDMDESEMKDSTTHRVFLVKMIITIIGLVVIIIGVTIIWITSF